MRVVTWLWRCSTAYPYCSRPLTTRRGWGTSSLIIQKVFRPSLGRIVAPELQVAWFKGDDSRKKGYTQRESRRFIDNVNLGAFRMYTRTYCNKPYACVKCGGPHNSSDCVKQKETPAKFALCGGNNPAKYRGCEHYHNIIKGNNPHRTPPGNLAPTTTDTYVPTITQPSLPLQQRSYAEAVLNDTQQP